MVARIVKTFGSVTVRGPRGISRKWKLDMGHSSLALYWVDNPERARSELKDLSEAIAFIAEKAIPPTSGVCRRCGCTDDWGCPEGCEWVDKEHTLCSACAEVEDLDAGC